MHSEQENKTVYFRATIHTHMIAQLLVSKCYIEAATWT